jgi:hypothetical protein
VVSGGNRGWVVYSKSGQFIPFPFGNGSFRYCSSAREWVLTITHILWSFWAVQTSHFKRLCYGGSDGMALGLRSSHQPVAGGVGLL